MRPRIFTPRRELCRLRARCIQYYEYRIGPLEEMTELRAPANQQPRRAHRVCDSWPWRRRAGSALAREAPSPRPGTGPRGGYRMPGVRCRPRGPVPWPAGAPCRDDTHGYACACACSSFPYPPRRSEGPSAAAGAAVNGHGSGPHIHAGPHPDLPANRARARLLACMYLWLMHSLRMCEPSPVLDPPWRDDARPRARGVVTTGLTSSLMRLGSEGGAAKSASRRAGRCPGGTPVPTLLQMRRPSLD